MMSLLRTLEGGATLLGAGQEGCVKGGRTRAGQEVGCLFPSVYSAEPAKGWWSDKCGQQYTGELQRRHP